MYLRAALKSIGDPPTKVRRAVIGPVVFAFVVATFLDSAFAQAPPPTLPAPAIGDLAAITKCLAGEGCTRPQTGTETVPPAAYAVDMTVKTMPELLRAQIRSFAQSAAAARCGAAEDIIAPLREKIRDAYEGGATSSLTPEQRAATRDYVDACLSPAFLASAGPLAASDEAYLKESAGLIVRRDNPDWPGPQPIFQAARLGTDGDPRADQDRDYAIFEIGQTPFLDENIEPLLGILQPFDNFITITELAGGFLTRGADTGAAPTLESVTFLQKNTLCRPGHVATDGILLHGCIIESILSTGAPFFQRQGGRLVFVGMHIGDTASLREPSLAGCAPGLNKYGIAIPPALLREVLSK